jgi:hypothetical protein
MDSHENSVSFVARDSKGEDHKVEDLYFGKYSRISEINPFTDSEGDVKWIKDNFIEIMELIEQKEEITIESLLDVKLKVSPKAMDALCTIFFVLDIGKFFNHISFSTYPLWKEYYSRTGRPICYEVWRGLSSDSKLTILRLDYDLYVDLIKLDHAYVIDNIVSLIDADYWKYGMDQGEYILAIIKYCNLLSERLNGKWNSILLQLFKMKYLQQGSAVAGRIHTPLSLLLDASNNAIIKYMDSACMCNRKFLEDLMGVNNIDIAFDVLSNEVVAEYIVSRQDLLRNMIKICVANNKCSLLEVLLQLFRGRCVTLNGYASDISKSIKNDPIKCDNCKVYPLVGTGWECTVCSNLIFCDGCYKRKHKAKNEDLSLTFFKLMCMKGLDDSDDEIDELHKPRGNYHCRKHKMKKIKLNKIIEPTVHGLDVMHYVHYYGNQNMFNIMKPFVNVESFFQTRFLSGMVPMQLGCDPSTVTCTLHGDYIEVNIMFSSEDSLHILGSDGKTVCMVHSRYTNIEIKTLRTSTVSYRFPRTIESIELLCIEPVSIGRLVVSDDIKVQGGITALLDRKLYMLVSNNMREASLIRFHDKEFSNMGFLDSDSNPPINNDGKVGTKLANTYAKPSPKNSEVNANDKVTESNLVKYGFTKLEGSNIWQHPKVGGYYLLENARVRTGETITFPLYMELANVTCTKDNVEITCSVIWGVHDVMVKNDRITSRKSIVYGYGRDGFRIREFY